jgi:hypothetical protein
MWGYNVCPLRIGGSRVITTNVWGLFDCKTQPCNEFSYMSKYNKMHSTALDTRRSEPLAKERGEQCCCIGF